MTNWIRTINIKDHLDPAKPLSDVRDPIAAVLKRDRDYGIDNDFSIIVDDLAEAQTFEDFNEALDGLYDWADCNRVWIGGTPAYRRSRSVEEAKALHGDDVFNPHP